MVRISYNNGESLAYWWINGYIDVNADQKPQVKADIANFLQWHRQTQLPQYAQLLTLAQRQLQGKVGRAELQGDLDQIEHYTQTMLLKAVPELTDLALSLRDGQLTHLEQKFARNNEEFRKDHLPYSVEKQQSRRYKKVRKEAESWLGSLSSEQEDKIRQLSDARPLHYEWWIEERVRRQQKILTILRQLQAEKPSREAAVTLVHDFLIASFEHRASPANQAYFDAYSESSTLMVLGIINSATPAQKAHASQKLQGWIDDAHALAAQAK